MLFQQQQQAVPIERGPEMSDHYMLEKLGYYRIAEDLKRQEQVRLADKLERAQRQTEQASARLSLRGLLHVLTFGAAFPHR